MLQSSSPSLISLSISQSALLLFLMPLLLPVSLLPFSFSKFSQFQTSAHCNLCIFLLSFQCECQVGMQDLSVVFLTFLVNNSCIWLIMFKCFVSLYREIPQDIAVLRFFKTFSGLCIYRFSISLKPHFSHNFQCSILSTLSCLTYLYSFCSSFEHSETICVTVSSAAPHT